MRGITTVWVVLGCLGAARANAAIATFDSFPEGDLGLSFADSGITFFGLDTRAEPGGDPFNIEWADGTLSGPGFSAPNALGFGAWVPGSGAALSQCGSFSFTAGSVQTFASIDLFEWLSPAGNTVWLEAYRGGVLVNTDSVVMPGNGLLNHWNLSVSGVPFDTLRVNGTGSADRGIFIGLVDNVVIIPAPLTAAALGVVFAPRRRRV